MPRGVYDRSKKTGAKPAGAAPKAAAKKPAKAKSKAVKAAANAAPSGGSNAKKGAKAAKLSAPQFVEQPVSPNRDREFLTSPHYVGQVVANLDQILNLQARLHGGAPAGLSSSVIEQLSAVFNQQLSLLSIAIAQPEEPEEEVVETPAPAPVAANPAPPAFVQQPGYPQASFPQGVPTPAGVPALPTSSFHPPGAAALPPGTQQ